MKYLLAFLILLLPVAVEAQSATPTEQVSKTIPATKSQNLLMTNQQKASLLLSDYLAREKAPGTSFAERKAILERTVSEAEKQIYGSWQYYLLKFIKTGKKENELLQLALQGGDKKTIYPYAVQHAIITNNSEKLSHYTAELKAITPISEAAYEYHSNTLMSAEKDATIYARGLLDLVPLAILQQQYGVRKDIRLRYYDDSVTTTNNAYLCISLGKEVLRSFPQAAYTGLLVKLKMDDEKELMSHLENDLSFGKLDSMQKWTNAVTQMYKNYLPALIIAFKYYKKNADARSEAILQRINTIAETAGVTAPVNKLLAE